jgi:hypothetical protein
LLPRRSCFSEELNSGAPEFVDCFREIPHRETGDRARREMLLTRIAGCKDFYIATVRKLVYLSRRFRARNVRTRTRVLPLGRGWDVR